jgi:hypothetical protein
MKFNAETADPNRQKLRTDKEEPTAICSITEKLFPNRDCAIMDKDEPSLQTALKEQLDPMCIASNTENMCPAFANPRTLKEDPRPVKSNTDNCCTDPTLAIPSTETEELRRANERRLQVEPNDIASRIEIPAPSRATLRKLIEDAI